MDKKYHQEVIRLRSAAVDLASRNWEEKTIPIPEDISMAEMLEVREVLDDTSWTVAGVSMSYVYFQRYVEDES